MGRRVGWGSRMRRTGGEGTGLVLGLAGLGESPLAGRVDRRCRRFVVGRGRLGYFVGVGDSCFGWGYCRRLTGLAVRRSDCRVEVALAGRKLSSVGRVGGRVGSAGCKTAWRLGRWRRSSGDGLRRNCLTGHNCLETHCIGQ